MTARLDAIHAAAKQLVALLNDRHEGLYTWNFALDNAMRRILEAAAQEAETPVFILQTPARREDGDPPMRCRYHCMYTQVDPCKVNHPNDPDHWCGFCSQNNSIPAIHSPRPGTTTEGA